MNALRGGASAQGLLALSEVVTQESDGVLTAWCWWEATGTDLKGSGLIKVGENGVLSEVLSYYTNLPA